eukprot:TRINITY_DN192_c0_g1_i1.p1 TRINITY_DN192_c0_g1~~TRINITY_DN192_c0_g1_i1.p1  ORF type:complete len:270 (+),score=69.09 TRINITY_DN192_c0_g1_i1:92-811(+)
MSQQTTQIVDLKYDPESYKGSAPDTVPACTDLLPWIEAAKVEKEKEEERKRKEKEAEQKKKEDEKKGGFTSFMGKAAAAATSVASSVGEGYDKVAKDLRDKIAEQQEGRWRSNVGINENLMYEYTCSIVSGGEKFSGYLYVSVASLTFYSLAGGARLKFTIPLKAVKSIQFASALPVKDGKCPYIQHVTNLKVKTDAFLIYTTDNRVHQFFAFGAAHDLVSSFYEHAYNVIDHSWRAAK